MRPPEIFAWGSLECQDFEAKSVSPSTEFHIAQDQRGAKVVAFRFDSEASNAIWCFAQAWRGEQTVTPLVT